MTEQLEKDPKDFDKLPVGQKPHYLCIGCSSSWVPARPSSARSPARCSRTATSPTLVVHTGINMPSVPQYVKDAIAEYFGLDPDMKDQKPEPVSGSSIITHQPFRR